MQEFFCNKCGYFGPVQAFHERPNGSGKCDYMAAPVRERRCNAPPPGWACSREPGHDGPCAASPHGVTLPPVVQPKNDDDSMLIDSLFRATLSGDSIAIDRARMSLRQRMNELRTAHVVEVTPEQAGAQINAARVLAEFAKTAPGRLPSHVQEALAVIDGVPPTPARTIPSHTPMEGE